MASKVKFPIDMKAYRHVILNLNDAELTDAQAKQLQKNIELARDAIVFFTLEGRITISPIKIIKAIGI